MALTICPECHQQVSTGAKGCPHCGSPGPFVPQAPTSPKETAKANHVSGGIVLLTFICLGAFIWWKAGGSSEAASATPPKVETQADKDNDAGMEAVMAARATVQTMLKDADSAKFTRQFAVKTTKGAIVACGTVNAKNGFGGYAGDAVYVMQDGVVRLENGANRNEVRSRWNATCAKLPPVYDKPHI